MIPEMNLEQVLMIINVINFNIQIAICVLSLKVIRRNIYFKLNWRIKACRNMNMAIHGVDLYLRLP